MITNPHLSGVVDLVLHGIAQALRIILLFRRQGLESRMSPI